MEGPISRPVKGWGRMLKANGRYTEKAHAFDLGSGVTVCGMKIRGVDPTPSVENCQSCVGELKRREWRKSNAAQRRTKRMELP